MIAGLSRVVLDWLFGVAMRQRIERVAGLVVLTLAVGLFLTLGIAFGDVRVIALMVVVGALLGVYIFRERLHVSTTIVRVVLVAAIALAFLGFRLFVAPMDSGS